MTRSLFSVVIPTRNRRGLLARALASVRVQSSAPREVIVVDDGSTDDTLEFLATQADVRVARSPGGGPGAARNAGAALAAGDYLAFLDSDDLWFPWTLAAMADAIEAHGRPAYVAGSFGFHRRQRARRRDARHHADAWVRELLFDVAGAAGVRRRHDRRSTRCVCRLRRFLDPGDQPRGSRPVPEARTGARIRADRSAGDDRWCQHPGGVTRDIHKSAQGCALVVATEKRGGYPGGSEWSRVRRNIITTHTRAFSLEALRAGDAAEACGGLSPRRWRGTCRLGRLRYVAAFPLLVAMRSVSRRWHEPQVDGALVAALCRPL